MNKDAVPNKYVLEAVNHVTLVTPPLWACQGSMTYFLNFGTSSITFERKKLDTSFFLC